MKRFGKKLERPSLKKRNTMNRGPGPVGKFIRGKGCPKCRRMREDCKCDGPFKKHSVPKDY